MRMEINLTVTRRANEIREMESKMGNMEHVIKRTMNKMKKAADARARLRQDFDLPTTATSTETIITILPTNQLTILDKYNNNNNNNNNNDILPHLSHIEEVLYCLQTLLAIIFQLLKMFTLLILYAVLPVPE